MVISGDTIKEASFYDEETGQNVKVSMPVKDLILLKLMEKIVLSLRK